MSDNSESSWLRGTDLVRFLALYESFGVSLTPEAVGTDGRVRVYIGEDHVSDWDKFSDSYNGFYTVVEFDAYTGKFVKQSFLE